jgi:hypothetical protein
LGSDADEYGCQAHQRDGYDSRPQQTMRSTTHEVRMNA